MAIKIGLEDLPPLLGAGIRFAIAGARAAAIARLMGGRCAPTRGWPAVLALLPFAAAYGLIYWGEQYVPSGLAAVLFGMMPLYSAVLAALLLAGEPLRARLVAGIAVALAGLSLAFGETLELGDGRFALAAAIACAAAPFASAIGNVAIKRNGGALDAVVLNGWAMLAGGALLLAVSALAEAWEVSWSARAVGSIAYLARDRLGRAVRDADDPAARAARGDDVLHHAAAAVRRARVRRRALRRGRSRCPPSPAPRSWPAGWPSPSGRPGGAPAPRRR